MLGKGCRLYRKCYILAESGQGGESNPPIVGGNDAVVLDEWYEDVRLPGSESALVF